MFKLTEIPELQLGISGLDAGLSEEEMAIQDVARRFAAEVMRPIAKKMDRMSPEEVAAPDSPIYEYLGKLQESGIFNLEAIADMSDIEKARIMPLIFEQLGWGDVGMAVIAALNSITTVTAFNTGDPELIEAFAGRTGCAIVTQPDRGSEFYDLQGDQLAPGARQHRGNLTAEIDGDFVVVNGQGSSWVSGASYAQTALAVVPCDYGDGIHNENGTAECVTMLLDLEVEGVSKGKPLAAMGQRSLGQCEIFFDNVRYPKKYITAEKDTVEGDFFGTISFANMEMGSIFTGLASAAYEHALRYCHERVQGGVPIIEHQAVQTRVYRMWEKVEAARAISRRATNYNYVSETPHLVASITAKTFCTRAAFDVATEALTLFGANGLTAEYPIEKLLRDASASLIEDGENTVIGLKAVTYLSKHFKQHNPA